MRFWREHGKLRIIIMIVFFGAGLAMVIGGWKLTGKITGLGIMILGLVLLLSALMIYNKPFEDPKR
ncbi:MAG: hypothetical protein HFG88_13445 [Dorea sp.]|nr:hypothetical protein [Dorea sp.]